MFRASVKNLFAGIDEDGIEERHDRLATGKCVRVERIVSYGHASPPGHWYDQDDDEWVMLLRGRARLRFEGHAEATVLEAGDSLVIPAHVRHRVDGTDEAALWLAVYYR
jgi:cupin 2 domain-containing protein